MRPREDRIDWPMDFAACAGEGCPRRLRCARFQAAIDVEMDGSQDRWDRQVYMAPPILVEANCDAYTPMGGR